MKKVFTIFAAIVMMVGFTTKVQAQSNTATSTGNNASATLLTKISITSTAAELAFGSFSSTTGGTVVIAATLAGAASTTGDVTTPTGTTSSAVFTVKGDPLGTYTVTPITGVNLVRAGGVGTNPSDVMAIAFSNSTPTAFDGTSGESPLYVGGTLTVKATQTPGAYTGTYDVKVNHN